MFLHLAAIDWEQPKGFPGGSDGKESVCSVRDLGLSPGLGRSPGEGKGYPLQYSGLENPVDCTDEPVLREANKLVKQLLSRPF